MLWLVFELPLGVIEYKLTSPGENIFTTTKSLVLASFALLFMLSISLLTKMRMHDVWAVSFSYFVVMFVFMVGIHKGAKREE
jgi:hypothetical protein